jgi:hypothetical protein
MVHNLVRFHLNYVRLGLSQNGVDHSSHATRLSNLKSESVMYNPDTYSTVLYCIVLYRESRGGRMCVESLASIRLWKDLRKLTLDRLPILTGAFLIDVSHILQCTYLTIVKW